MSKLKVNELIIKKESNELAMLLIGDPHFKVSNVAKTDTLLTDVSAYVTKLKIDIVICLGDILDRHETSNVHVHCRAVKFLRTLAAQVPTILLIGNHDRPNNSVFLTEEHFFTGLTDPQLDIVDTGLLKKVKVNNLTYSFLCMPYVPPGKFRAALEHVGFSDLSEVRAVFAHQEVQGCIMGAISSSEGDVWTAADPPMFTGHIHERQNLPRKGQANVHFIGTPFQHNRAESPEKGVAKLIFAPTNYQLEFLPLNIRPMTIVQLTPDEVYGYVLPSGADLEIVVRGKAEELRLVEKSPQFKILRKLAHVSVKEIKEQEPCTPKSYTRTSYWDSVAARLNERQQQMLFNLLVKQ